MKSKLYSQPRIHNVPELQQRVLELSDRIPPQMIDKSIQAFYNRLGYCTMAEKQHFEQYLKIRGPREDIVLEYED